MNLKCMIILGCIFTGKGLPISLTLKDQQGFHEFNLTHFNSVLSLCRLCATDFQTASIKRAHKVFLKKFTITISNITNKEVFQGQYTLQWNKDIICTVLKKLVAPFAFVFSRTDLTVHVVISHFYSCSHLLLASSRMSLLNFSKYALFLIFTSL